MKALFLSALLALAPVYAGTLPEQAQASNLAAAAVQQPQPHSILAATHCEQLIALVVIDNAGDMHPVQLKGLTDADIHKIVSLVPAEKVLNMIVPCPEEKST